jgi:hypothetical protein
MGSVELALTNNGEEFLKTALTDMSLNVLARKYVGRRQRRREKVKKYITGTRER